MSLLGSLGKELLTDAGKGIFNTLKKKAPKLSEDDILKQVRDLGAEFFNTVDVPKTPVVEMKKPVTEVLGMKAEPKVSPIKSAMDNKEVVNLNPKKLSDVISPVVKEDPNNLVFKFEPKPGEVTGRQAENAIYGLRKEDKITDPNYAKFVSQIEKAKEKNKLDASSSISNYINMFSRFQDMNIPREYTGKLANGMSKYLNNIDINSSMNYYDTMRELPLIKQLKTKNQIETFISLLPDWKNNISDLVDVAKLI